MRYRPSIPLPIAAALRKIRRPGAARLGCLTGLAVGMLVGLPVLAPPASGADRICTATAKAAKTACRAEVQDDYWITVGNCHNISSRMDRKDCLNEAKEVRREERAFCGEQSRARRELCDAIGEAAYEPDVTPVVIGGRAVPLFIPENFPEDPFPSAAMANPYFPLVRGTRWVYQGIDAAGEPLENIVVTVEDEVKNIGGVNCLTVRDVVREGDDLNGPIIEDTDDWYAQDFDGNVWYCGEIVLNYEVFEQDPDPQVEIVDIEGSWKGFRDFARPGINMLADPQVGDVYRQEIALGNAEDAARIVSVTETDESVPAADCSENCLVIEEFTPVEPDTLGFKIYAPGFGIILETDPESDERVELVEFSTP